MSIRSADFTRNIRYVCASSPGLSSFRLAMELLQQHSGGKVSQALGMALETANAWLEADTSMVAKPSLLQDLQHQDVLDMLPLH